MIRIERMMDGPLMGGIESRLSTVRIVPNYRQILGGMVLPYGNKTGFAVVVAEDRCEDPVLHLLHKWVLAEIEERDPMRFMERCLEHEAAHQVQCWYGGFDDNGTFRLLEEFNRMQRARLKHPLYNVPPPCPHDRGPFQFYIDLIKEHTTPGRETLHFLTGGSLQKILRDLPKEAAHRDISDYPPLAALGYALASLCICCVIPVATIH